MYITVRSDNNEKTTQSSNEKLAMEASITAGNGTVTERFLPEAFHVEGSMREGGCQKRRKISNKRKIAHNLRIAGEEYIRPRSKKLVLARTILKPRCSGVSCQKLGRMCSIITDTERQAILVAFYGTVSLQLQREYIVRHINREPKKETKTQNNQSRRAMSNYYFLPKGGSTVKVCKKMFLNTLNVSEKTARTALAKKKDSGVIEKDKRGGRYGILRDRDEKVRKAIRAHTERFPRMESHYCRKSTTREYLHPDLTLTKMYDMFIEQYRDTNITTTYQTYGKVFRDLNLFFHHPKKDVCGLCIA